MNRREMFAAIQAASTMPPTLGQPVLRMVLEQLKNEPLPGVTHLLIRGLGQMYQRSGNPNVAVALREARELA